MYCSECGQPLAANQSYCSHCGRTANQGYSQPIGYPSGNRVQRHIQTLGILWLAYSLFAVLAWFVAMPFLGFVFGHAGHGFGPHEFRLPVPLHWLLSIGTIVIYGRAALGILVGIGLLRRERWARTLALVVGILTLIKVPFGTALGIYTLWVMLPAQSAQEYEMVAAP